MNFALHEYAVRHQSHNMSACIRYVDMYICLLMQHHTANNFAVMQHQHEIKRPTTGQRVFSRSIGLLNAAASNWCCQQRQYVDPLDWTRLACVAYRHGILSSLPGVWPLSQPTMFRVSFPQSGEGYAQLHRFVQTLQPVLTLLPAYVNRSAAC